MVIAVSTHLTIERTMSFILQPWQFFVVILVGWVNREQKKIIEFYQTQVEALMKSQGKKRLLLTDDQRRLLAVKGKALGRKALMELTTIVTPDTILRWHRQPPPKDARFNYITDVWIKWIGSTLYFGATYACPGPTAISPSFETRFARLEHAGGGRFTLSYMRHNDKWFRLPGNSSADECLESISNDGHFQLA